MSNSKCAGIYSITSKINGKRYIGSSIRICEGWKIHLRDLNYNKHHSIHLQNHYNKYGKDDLMFMVVETVERDELSLKNFKTLILQREQTYLENWKQCEFNILKVAGSNLGYKRPNTKNYFYVKNRKVFIVYFILEGRELRFGQFKSEEEAQFKVDSLKVLSDENKVQFHINNCRNRSIARLGKKTGRAKGYYYSNYYKNWKVEFKIEGIKKGFGTFKTEELAKEKADQIKKELGQL